VQDMYLNAMKPSRGVITARAGTSCVSTREEWLIGLVHSLRPAFDVIGHSIPERVRVTCGWPSRAALARSGRVIGECWYPAASADHTAEIFISPCLGDAIGAAETLVHELIHAGGARGHRGKFPAIAKAIGLAKPWRATRATPELRERLNALIWKIGPYPHATLDASMLPRKKDGTRLHKLVCPACGYTVRTTARWIRVGMPTCPCGMKMTMAGTEMKTVTISRDAETPDLRAVAAVGRTAATMTTSDEVLVIPAPMPACDGALYLAAEIVYGDAWTFRDWDPGNDNGFRSQADGFFGEEEHSNEGS
jgi:hypothetical protein